MRWIHLFQLKPITPLGQKDVNMSIVVHHQPHFTTQKPNETVIWGYFLYPRREGEFVHKQYIKMTGKEMLEELLGQLSKVDPGPTNIMKKKDQILGSVINCIPVYMPYASAPLQQPGKGWPEPKVIPDFSTNLAFYRWVCWTTISNDFHRRKCRSVWWNCRLPTLPVYLIRKLVKTPRYDHDPVTLMKAAKRMFD